jgi:hypothetical protein
MLFFVTLTRRYAQDHPASHGKRRDHDTLELMKLRRDLSAQGLIKIYRNMATRLLVKREAILG